MRTWRWLLPMLCLWPLAMAHAASVELQWDAPTTNEDGSPLQDLAGFKIYHGLQPRDYPIVVDVGSVTRHTVTALRPGITHYFAATAYDTSDNESDFSNEVTFVAVQDYQVLSLPLLRAHSNNFSPDRSPDRLLDGCYEGTGFGEPCTAGTNVAGSFWLEFDLRAVKALTRTRLYGDAVGAWVSNAWTLQYKSAEQDAWQTAFAASNALGTQWFERALTDLQARYVRVEVTGNPTAKPGSVQARELELYATEPIVIDTVAPTAKLLTPLANETVVGLVTIEAEASDNVAVAKVEIQVDGVVKATLDAAPYSWGWDTTNGNTHPCLGPNQHQHTLQAIAYDAEGNRGSSQTVTVHMDDPPYCTVAAPQLSILITSPDGSPLPEDVCYEVHTLLPSPGRLCGSLKIDLGARGFFLLLLEREQNRALVR